MEGVWLAATVLAGGLFFREYCNPAHDPNRLGMLAGAIVITSVAHSIVANEGVTAWNVGLFLMAGGAIGLHVWKLLARRA